MSNLTGRKAGAVFSYLLMLAEIASGLLFTPFLIRILGQAEYGVYSLSLSITTYFTLLDLGVGNAMVRYLAKFKVEGDHGAQRRFLGLAIVFYSIVCIIMLAIYMVLSQNMQAIFANGLTADEVELATGLLGITVLNAGFTLLVSVFDKVLIAYEHFAASKIIQIVRIAIRVAVQVGLLLMGLGSFGIVVSNLVITIGYGAVVVAYVVKRLQLTPSFRGFDLSFVREIFGYTAFVFVQMVATQINSMAGQIILGMMASSVILGIYAVGTQINQYYQIIAGGVNGVTMPGIVALVSKGATNRQIEDEMTKVTRISLLVMGIILGGFIAVGDEFVVLWAGAENTDAYYVALILMVPMAIALVQSSGSQVLWAAGKHKIQAVIKIVVAVASIFLTVALISWDPLMGAALGPSISCFFGDVVAMNIVFRRDIGIKVTRYYRKTIKGILPSVLIASLCGFLLKMALPSGWVFLLLMVAATLMLYLACLMLFGFNNYEKDLMKSLLFKLSKS